MQALATPKILTLSAGIAISQLDWHLKFKSRRICRGNFFDLTEYCFSDVKFALFRSKTIFYIIWRPNAGYVNKNSVCLCI